MGKRDAEKMSGSIVLYFCLVGANRDGDVQLIVKPVDGLTEKKYRICSS